MNLVKWLRKNNKKILAVVVVIIMIGFIGGAYIRQLKPGKSAGLDETIAYFGNNEKITNYDRITARRELEILQELRANNMLRSIVAPAFGTQEIRAMLLGELLFWDRRTSARLSRHIKQLIRVNQCRISDKQVNDIYTGSAGKDIYWLLLKKEAEQVGIDIKNKDAGAQLGRIIPRLFEGATYSQVIGSIVNRRGIPEKDILTVFGKLLAVYEYARTICSGENVTTSQIMHKVSMENETIDVEFVNLDASVFAETQNQPTQQEMDEHFGRYRKFFSGEFSEENPYGFGYKLADRAGLEYIAVKLDDVSSIITAPTQEEAEKHYQRYREQFTEQILSDPNDPNSPPVKRTKTYAEVAGEVSNYLLRNKINSKAEKILYEAKTLTEAGFEDTDTESQALSSEQFRQLAGDYKTTADQLSEKYKIMVYTGQTGLLEAVDMQTDEYLGRLYLRGYGHDNIVALTRVVFAIDQLKASELGPFDVPKPRMYENIGPVRDMLGQIMMIARVTKAEKAGEPESINQTISKETLKFAEPGVSTTEKVYTIADKIAEDLKKLSAMDTTRSKTEEFIGLAAEVGWESAVEKFNKLHGQTEKQNEDDPNTFNLQNFTGLRRISKEAIEILTVQNAGNPTARFLVNGKEKERYFIEQLYSLVPQDSNTLDSLPVIMEFRPGMSCYCLSNISIKRVEQQEYERIKGIQAYKEDAIGSQNLAAVHFNPENILKRMNFKWAEQEPEVTDINTPVEIDTTGKEAS